MNPKSPDVIAHEREPTRAAKIPQLDFDPNEFISALEPFDITDQEAIEYLNTIWRIACTFVDIQFGLHPLQTTPRHNFCGQLTQSLCEAAIEASDSPLDVLSYPSVHSDIQESEVRDDA